MQSTDVVTRATDMAATAGRVLLEQLQHARLPGIGGASVKDRPDVAARRWRGVTVLCSPEQIGAGDRLPAPLAAFGDRIEIRIQPAPANKGTELAARFVGGGPTDQDIGALRSALRRAKQLIEVGEVLRVDPQPHGHRKPTPQGGLLEGMTEEAPKEGVL